MSTSLAEGQSTNRPPLFFDTNFSYRKARMKIYIQAVNYHSWRVIVNGPQILLVRVNGMDIPKPEEDWDDNDMKMGELNAKAMNVLYYALDSTEFSRISTCTTAQEIWNKL